MAGIMPWPHPSWQNPAMNTQDVTLQLADPEDAAVLAEMSRDMIESGLGWRYRTRSLRQLIADAETVALVARHGGAVAGFGIMKFGDERAHLVLLAVQPDARRRGIARRIVEWLVASAATAGVATIHVELRAGNAGAYALYRSLGFEETLRVPGYYSGRETAIRMLRLLRAPFARVG
jgi:ribosomal-protein-alanine N-acetyltransferase